MDIRGVVEILLPASECVRLNGRIRDQVYDILGAMDKGNGNEMEFLVAVRIDGLLCCTLLYTGGCCMELVTLWLLLTLVSTSLSTTTIPLQRGRCAMKSVQCKQPVTSGVNEFPTTTTLGELLTWPKKPVRVGGSS